MADITDSAQFLLPICRQIMSAGSARFLLTICWHSMSALSTNPEPNADTDGYGFALRI